jgi:hypothetical protein
MWLVFLWSCLAVLVFAVVRKEAVVLFAALRKTSRLPSSLSIIMSDQKPTENPGEGEKLSKKYAPSFFDTCVLKFRFSELKRREKQAKKDAEKAQKAQAAPAKKPASSNNNNNEADEEALNPAV